MSTPEIKRLLHESIENINDKELLLMLKQLAEREYTQVAEPKLADWQKKRIAQSKQQIKKGDFFTNEEADKLVEKWLNEE